MSNLEDLRVKLDQTSERIVSRLKDRSRFPLNQPIYIADAVKIQGRSGISLLQFAIEGMEIYHASLGRYEYRDQHPILSLALTRGQVVRADVNNDLPDVEIKITDNMLTFYSGLLPDLCQKNDDPITYGETAYIDADTLEVIHERINTVGRYVAHSKFNSNPNILQCVENDDLIKKALRNTDREDIVVSKAKKAAVNYNIDPDLTEKVFRWIIKETVDVEVMYLKSIARQKGFSTKTKISH